MYIPTDSPVSIGSNGSPLQSSRINGLKGSSLRLHVDHVSGHTDGVPGLPDVDDPSYFSCLELQPQRQVVIHTSKLGAGVPVVEKIRWLDQELSHLQCPYPIEHIQFTHSGDAVVQFISPPALEKSLYRHYGLLRWRNMDIPFGHCTEDDIRALQWVGVAGCALDLVPSLRQALQVYGEIRGECPPPQNGHLVLAHHQPNNSPFFKFYFNTSSQARLPPVLPVSRPKGLPPLLVSVFTPHGPLAPTCADFGKSHSQHGCPECYGRQQLVHAGA